LTGLKIGNGNPPTFGKELIIEYILKIPKKRYGILENYSYVLGV